MKLEDQLRAVIRRKGMALSTEKTYVSWYRHFVKFHNLRHPKTMGDAEVNAFLTHLAVNRRVAAATQNQALNALVFFFREVMKREDLVLDAQRAKTGKRLPTVLSVGEVKRVLEQMEGTPRVVTGLLYGCGMRVNEVLRLRVKDADFENGVVWVRQGKGGKDRCLSMPAKLTAALERQVARAQTMYDEDEANGGANVYTPNALEVKDTSIANRWEWFWVFPAASWANDPREVDVRRRHHIVDAGVSRWIKKACVAAGIEKKVSAHTFRHSYATHLLQKGIDLRTIQEALGHSSIKTTEVYTHVVHAMAGRAGSPLDDLDF